MKWFRLAAEQGDRRFQWYLGHIYAEGRVVARDYGEAEKWSRLSAEQGHLMAQFQLGEMYLDGTGVTRDKVQAYVWFSLAARHGYPEGAKYRDSLAKKMSPEQIAEGQRKVEEWKQKGSLKSRMTPAESPKQ